MGTCTGRALASVPPCVLPSPQRACWLPACMRLQVRGILHALERHAPLLARAGDLPLLVRQLQEWCAARPAYE